MNWVTKLSAKRKKRKAELIKEKRISSRWSFVLDVAEIIIPCCLFIFCLVIIVYLFFNLKVQGIDTIVDFLIASASGFILVYSLVNIILSDRWKYITLGIIWIIACSIGFVILMIVSLNLKDGSIARNISLLSLFSSGIIELKEYIIFIIGYATKRKTVKELEIEDINKKSIFDKTFD